MTSVFNQCSLGGVDKTPTSAITDRATLEGYESLLVAVERINKNAKATGGDVAFLNKGIEFKGIPVYYDEAAAAGEVRFLNPKFLKLCYLTWMKMLEPVEPANALTRTYRVQTFGNLLTDGSKYLGVVSAIT
jgi:hypothetical protein